MAALATVAEQVRALPPAEIVAVATAVAYLALAIRQSIWCWPAACVSTALYVHLFSDRQLYMEAGLNVFYFAMALYGWRYWLRGTPGTAQSLPVTRWPWRAHAVATAAIAALAALSGGLLTTYTDAALPYVDSLTTWSALWATFLVARKVFENWWYWLVIDSLSVVICWHRGLELTALLFALYVLMIPFGIVAWRRSLAEHAATRAAVGPA